MKNKISNMMNKINEGINEHKIVFIVFAFFPYIYHIHLPNGSIPLLEFTFSRLRVLNLLILVSLFIWRKKKPSNLLKILFISDMWLVATTAINNPLGLKKAILYFSSSLAIAILVELFIEDIEEMIKAIILCFEIEIYPNMLTVMLYSNLDRDVEGYNMNHFLLGTKNNMVVFLFPAFFICVLYLLFIKKYKRPLILSGSIFLTVLFSYSKTTLLLFLMCFTLMLFGYLLKDYKKINFTVISAIGLFAICLIVTVPYLIYGENSLIDFFSKNIYYNHSFLDRVEIWVNSKSMLSNNILFGNGYESVSIIAGEEKDVYLHAHNEIVQRMLTTGLVGLSLFVVFYYELIKKISKKRDVLHIICSAFVVSIMISFLSESYHRFFEFNLIFFISYNISLIATEKIKNSLFNN